MAKVVVITGASAGVGRATARAFAMAGFDVGLIARGLGRLEAAAAEVRKRGRLAVAVSADVADAAAIGAAAQRIEAELGSISIWVNNAMSTVFAPVQDVTAEELLRGTQVTYLGQVHGTMAALRCMRPRRAGTIVNIGSALCYRSVPLQAVYCGAKSAVRGFTDSLRSELIHDRAGIHLTMVHLPAVNTPQFDWALNKLGHQAQPVAPVYQPEVAARAIVFAATHKRREVWVGMPTVVAIMANRIAPGLADRYLSARGYDGQMTSVPTVPDAPANLFEPVADDGIAAHGRFGAQARSRSWEMVVERHPGRFLAAACAGLVGLHLLARRLKV